MVANYCNIVWIVGRALFAAKIVSVEEINVITVYITCGKSKKFSKRR